MKSLQNKLWESALRRAALWAAGAFLLVGGSSAALAAAPQPLRTISVIRALSNEDADRALPVDFEATVTYYRASNRDLFMQEGDSGIYVHAATRMNLAAGDRVRVLGTTHGSFKPYVESKDIRLLGHGALPKPDHVTFAQMIRGETDCKLVTVRATVRSADIVPGAVSMEPSTYLQMFVDGEPVDANVDSVDGNALKDLLDAEVEITGVVSGHFDNKMQLTGILFHTQNLDDVKILQRAHSDPWSLPITPMDSVITGYRMRDMGERMRVHGTITYYQAGSALVLQDGAKSLWIATQSHDSLKIGDVADVIGFPEVQNGFLHLTRSEVRDSGVQAPIAPSLFTWRELAQGGNKGHGHIFDLASIEGRVVAEVRQATQDEYVLETDGHLFSAILRHTGHGSLSPMKHIPEGSAIRVTGVCMLSDSNPFNGDVPFNIWLRSVDDIVVVARPSLLSVGNLVKVVSLLLVIVAAVCAWVWMLRRKVQRQTAELAKRIESEAIRERKRSQILEDINGNRPLDEILLQITELVAFRLGGARCWCEVGSELKQGSCPENVTGLEIIRQEISSRSGPLHGLMFVAVDQKSEYCAQATAVLPMGAWLATLAIETRGLYSDLVHRSEFDQLTEIFNRFSFERRLDSLIDECRQLSCHFGLIYIDLDDFKLVNDQYGHRAGDQLLRQSAARMKRQLRANDMLARLGGDEFAALITNVQGHSDLEEVAARLQRCFEETFAIDGYSIRGSVSMGFALFPEDGSHKDSLLSAADAAMYVDKKIKKEARQNVAR